MSALYIWIIVAAVCLVLELFTSGFGVFCFTVGALGGVAASLLGWDITGQVIAFCVVSLVSFVFLRPLLLRVFFQGKDEDKVKTNADALVGRTGVVIEAIDRGAKTGLVKIDGDVWQAVPLQGDPIAAGCEVRVVSRESIVLTVEPLTA